MRYAEASDSGLYAFDEASFRAGQQAYVEGRPPSADAPGRSAFWRRVGFEAEDDFWALVRPRDGVGSLDRLDEIIRHRVSAWPADEAERGALIGRLRLMLLTHAGSGVMPKDQPVVALA